MENSSKIKETSSWPMSTTKIMLVKMKKYSKLLEKREIKTKRNMWELIAEEMAQSNFFYSSVQVENKWKGLCRKYRQTRDYNIKFKSYGSKKTSPFEKEVLEILNKRNKVFGQSEPKDTSSFKIKLPIKNDIVHMETPIKIEQFDVMDVGNPLELNTILANEQSIVDELNYPLEEQEEEKVTTATRTDETTLGDIKNMLEGLMETIRDTSERAIELKEQELKLKRETNDILRCLLKKNNF